MSIFFGIIKTIYYVVIIPIALYSYFAVRKQEKEAGIVRTFAGSWGVVICGGIICIFFLVAGIPKMFQAISEGQMVSVYNFITWGIGYILYYPSYKVFDKEATMQARAQLKADTMKNAKEGKNGFVYTVTTWEDGSKTDDYISNKMVYELETAATPFVTRVIYALISIFYAPIMCYFNLWRHYTIVLVRQWLSRRNQTSA